MVVVDHEHPLVALDTLVIGYRHLCPSTNEAVARYRLKGLDVDIRLDVATGHGGLVQMLEVPGHSPKGFGLHHKPAPRLKLGVDGLSSTLDGLDRVDAVCWIVCHLPWPGEAVYESSLVGELAKGIDKPERADSGDKGSSG
jgi:hypothetical protein